MELLDLVTSKTMAVITGAIFILLSHCLVRETECAESMLGMCLPLHGVDGEC